MSDEQVLFDTVSAQSPASIADVIAMMESIDAVLTTDDGLKWFNFLYLLVTREVQQRPPATGWLDPQWLSQLDVAFANLYFQALRNWHNNPNSAPRAWRALFESRYKAGIARIQFALCGMNAHINHDLPFALVQTDEAAHLTPTQGSPQHRDFESVNNILEQVEAEAMQYLSTGLLGTIAQDTGKLGGVLAMWKVRQARDTAWTNGEILWQIKTLKVARDKFSGVLDKMTGYAGRGLLIPVE
ncbi:MAG: DUF5995 family protein [Pyrinomonadaceae bacterium]